MQVRFLLSCCLLLLAFTANAQDTLYRTNGEKLVVRVTEVSASEIKYRRSAGTDGPLYVIRASEVSKVVYADGHSDVFVRDAKTTPTSKSNTTRPKSTPNERPTDNGIRRKHFIGLGASDLLPGIISLSYEGNIYKDNVSIRIPISIGLGALSGATPAYNGFPDFYYYSRNKIFSTGLDLRYYPAGQKFSSYFLGLSWEYGQVNYTGSNFFPTPQPLPIETRTTWFSAIGVTNGVLIQPTDQLNISLYVTLGTQITGIDNITGYRGMFRGGVILGWRFGNSTGTKDGKKKGGVLYMNQ